MVQCWLCILILICEVKLGKKREEWKVSDFDIAFEKLAVAEEFVEKILIEYLRLDEEEY